MRIQMKSLPFLQNKKLILIHFLILPIIQILVILLLNQQYAKGLNPQVAMASVYLSANSFCLSTMAYLLVVDYLSQIFREVLVHKPWSLSYWGRKFATSLLLSLIMFLINGGLLLMIGVDNLYFWRCLAALPLSLLFSAGLGIAGYLLSVHRDNIYLFTNLFTAILPLMAGVVAPISAYPPLFKEASYVFPYGQVVEGIYQGETSVLFILVYIAIIFAFNYSCLKGLKKQLMAG
ncbi:ABC transporter permease [Aerococcus urinae]|uniref:ABC transporter permease n=1 Tax=Aerococcus mictus TaxID=2976810 RepID=A0A1E9PPX1_9LACT|nr:MULTISPECIES: ABC transporter permease [Aerococcus]KAA9292880.1 hypothetical protein F6I06_02515 [Aerococcus mictus]MBU5610403.1 ABC transporter permease [Aerococcus urinae]MCY3033720.1 ABC transporter permease [Aerococcus mictus]MCY3063009.1 ABC transporter permease [Aerococcus mictus]MCY3065022.1 ABC transporter permease [Aerococcus mictus]